MQGHGEELAEGPFSDARLQAELKFTKLRDAVAAHFDYRYKRAHRDVRWDCEQFAQYLTWFSFDYVGVSDQLATHPGTSQLFDTYRRLVFAFTNPADLRDGVDERAIRDFTGPISVTASRDDNEINMQLFINGLEVRSTFLLSNLLEFEGEGRLKDMSYAARFECVSKYTLDYFNSLGPGNA